jgi:hypothetical protein
MSMPFSVRRYMDSELFGQCTLNPHTIQTRARSRWAAFLDIMDIGRTPKIFSPCTDHAEQCAIRYAFRSWDKMVGSLCSRLFPY